MKNIDVKLEPGDLLRAEEALCGNLARFLDFNGHAVYFPDNQLDEPVWLAEERKLLLPLIWNGGFLGVLLLSGVKGRQVKPLLPFLIEIAALCLDVEALRITCSRDRLTGMASEETLYRELENELETIRGGGEEISASVQFERQMHRLCIGLIILGWGNSREALHDFGPEFCREVFLALANGLLAKLPEGVIAAPLARLEGRFEFGLLVRAGGTRACSQQAATFLENLREVSVKLPVSGKYYNPDLYAGFALYPHDLRAGEGVLPVFEQVRRLRDRARLAFDLAVSLAGQKIKVLGNQELTSKAGRILECLPDGGYRLNLGLSVNVDVGARFDVFGFTQDAGTLKKGQLVVVSSRPFDSVAELLYLGAAVHPAPGDIAKLASPSENVWAIPHTDGKENVTTGENWLDYSAFFAQFSELSGPFGLGLCQLLPSPAKEADFIGNLERMLVELPVISMQPLLRGKFGNGGFLFYHENTTGPQLKTFYDEFTALALNNGIIAQVGIFVWPFLDYGKNEAEVCAQKALECAKLLPPPQVAFFDSVALTVNADKLHSVGDTIGAVREYEAAVLADPKNFMALNSLGVALAALGKFGEGKRQMGKALAVCKEPQTIAQICYNLGAIHQQEKNLTAAKNYYRRAVSQNPHHAWAWLRLGQLAVINGRKADAGRMFEKALSVAGDDETILNAARRQIAKLQAKREKLGEAREILYDNLLANPDDVPSLLELARLYLENSEDPVMAELLALRGLERGGGRLARNILAQALEKQGKFEEATKVRQAGV